MEHPVNDSEQIAQDTPVVDQEVARPPLEKDQVLTLVIDSAPLLKGTPLRHLAQRFCTIPEVVGEIRDKNAREHIKKLPFELELITPSDEAIKAVVDFSRKTGDFSTLSSVDLKVLALTYMLEVEANGTTRLRTEPVKTKVNKKPRQPTQAPESDDDVEEEEAQDDDDTWEVAGRGKNKAHRRPVVHQAAPTPTHVTEALNDLKVEETAEENSTSSESKETTDAVPEDDEDDEDAGEWITPENVVQVKAAELGHQSEGKTSKFQVMQVACITADFAMQNVLLQMNLNLVSTDGMRVKRIKNWVMRCHACYTVTSDMDKKFCPKCGNSSLMRTSCSTDQYGNVTYWLKKNFQYNLRGTKYNIPKPQGGTKANNIVLREDQKEYMKAMNSRRKKKQTNAFDPDFMPSFNLNPEKQINSNMYGTETIGFGRKNPNATSRRRR
ncbi:Nin one binding Zn-ribbon like-domain-containing protein [Umbelopsis sp. AD052]|nr:Nin one binding Zn-ribbon like-domain-containing protein [Umbelopsis sp. AD052]